MTASVAADPQRETSAEGRLAFAAATIKLAAPDAVRIRVMATSPNRLYIPSMTLMALIYTAALFRLPRSAGRRHLQGRRENLLHS